MVSNQKSLLRQICTRPSPILSDGICSKDVTFFSTTHILIPTFDFIILWPLEAMLDGKICFQIRKLWLKFTNTRPRSRKIHFYVAFLKPCLRSLYYDLQHCFSNFFLILKALLNSDESRNYPRVGGFNFEHSTPLTAFLRFIILSVFYLTHYFN